MKNSNLDHLYYLLLIRWVALAAFSFITFGLYFFVPDNQVNSASVVILIFYAFTNIFFHFFHKKIAPPFIPLNIFAYLLFDVLVLTLLISQNGGAHNPFSILFLVFCGLGALILPKPYLLILISVTLISLTSIYSSLPPDMGAGHEHHMPNFNLHLRGMWLANSLGVLLVCGWIYYMRYLNEQVIQKHEATQKVLANMEKVESLGRIVAQASHQLNTPLGTLQLGISELSDEKNPLNISDQKRWHEDMQHAVRQISLIISKIQTASITTENISSGLINLEAFVSDWITHWSGPRHQIISFENKMPQLNIQTGTAENMGHILTVLLDNASDAIDKKDGSIKVQLSNKGDSIFLSVIDNGCGMDEKTRNQALEPLFTTKNKGTGLGLYLCHQLATKYGGGIEITTKPAQGAEIKIRLEKKLL